MFNMRTVQLIVLIVGLVFATAASTLSQETTADDSIWTRSHLTGDWGGDRSRLKDRGVTLDLEYTALYQGLLSGADTKDFEYGGRVDAFITLDSTKLGLWKGGGLKTHLEYRHGSASTHRGGVILPTNTGMVSPIGESNKLVATSLYLTQNIGKEATIMIGKINGPDLMASNKFFGGWGTKRFWNSEFVTPPIGIGPACRIGVITQIRTKPVTWSLSVFDPDNRTDDYFPSDLFSNGVELSLSATRMTKWAGRTTSLSLGGGFSTKEGVDLSEVPFPPDLETTEKKGSWSVGFTFMHHLQESVKHTDSNWGLFLKAGIWDGNPSPVQGSILGGIGGNALFLGRPEDNFGVGIFYTRFSSVLRSTIEPEIDIDSEYGVEAFYSYAVTPWLYLSGDLQFISPGRSGLSNATIAGLRLNVRF